MCPSRINWCQFLKDTPLGIDLLKKDRNSLNKKVVIHVFFCIAIQVPNLQSLMQSSFNLSPLNIQKPSRTPLVALIDDTPPNSLKDSNVNLNVKTTTKRVRVHSLAHNTLGVRRVCQSSKMGTMTSDKQVNYSHAYAQIKQQIGQYIFGTFIWMSKGAYDIFIFVINFLGKVWLPKHITIGLFNAMDTYGQALAKDFIELLGKCNLLKKYSLFKR